MVKRKRSSVTDAADSIPSPAILQTNVASVASNLMPSRPARRIGSRKCLQSGLPAKVDTNPDTNLTIEDSQEALRASPDDDEPGEGFEPEKVTRAKKRKSVIALEPNSTKASQVARTNTHASKKANSNEEELLAVRADPDAEGEEGDADPEEVKDALSRPPPVNSSYLPLPWKGRLGYACLNTYLRTATPPVFSSRTCRIASILEHRHPLKNPTQPEHTTKNRPDKEQPADIARGQAYVESLGLANAMDIPKMLRWNDRYGIKFLRLSSEMFPFASHEVYGYKLARFASEALAEAGRVAAELGHRLTTHPGQFTQLGSPRPEVIKASFRDLEYHCELLSLLNLPPQQDRDAVMILHMGGIFGDKDATLERFRGNYAKLPQKVKDRLVLENDDVCYSVHDLLPICEDYHHHNIIFDTDKIREGTLDIMTLYDRIKATWDRKKIKQKMHYSEPTPAAITGRQRRKHNPRVSTLPPCAPDMDLMIEAKDKEQAVFELMRTFKLPAFETFSDITPYTRNDENKPWKSPIKKSAKKRTIKDPEKAIGDETESKPPPTVPDEEVSMGGTEGRVYWPSGMEEWLRPKKREVKARDPAKAKTTAEKAADRRAEKAAWQAAREASADEPIMKIGKEEGSLDAAETKRGLEARDPREKSGKTAAKPKDGAKAKAKNAYTVPTPSTSDHDHGDLDDEEKDDEEDSDMPDITDGEDAILTSKNRGATKPAANRRRSGRSANKLVKSYAEEDD